MRTRDSKRTSRRRRGAVVLATLAALGAGCDQPPADQASAKGQKPGQSAKQEQSAKPERKTPRPRPETVIAAGTVVSGALQGPVATDRCLVGDAVTLRVVEPVVVGGAAVVPAGAAVHGRVTHVQAAGRMKGGAELTLRFHELVLPNGKRYDVTCEPVRMVSKGDGKETAAEIGGGAAVGGILGGVVGGKDDILKGVAIGAAVGTGVAAATKGEQIVLPAGHKLRITLVSPVTLAAGATS